MWHRHHRPWGYGYGTWYAPTYYSPAYVPVVPTYWPSFYSWWY